MDEPPRASDATTQHASRVSELAHALHTCHAQLAAVRDRNDRRKMRVSADSWEALRRAVSGYTRSAKSAGEFPEHVLIRLRQITTEHAPSLDSDSPMRQAIIRLSLQAYFDESTVQE